VGDEGSAGGPRAQDGGRSRISRPRVLQPIVLVFDNILVIDGILNLVETEGLIHSLFDWCATVLSSCCATIEQTGGARRYGMSLEIKKSNVI
jgi:hypothetical protein